VGVSGGGDEEFIREYMLYVAIVICHPKECSTGIYMHIIISLSCVS
jgi:hypothetical protein